MRQVELDLRLYRSLCRDHFYLPVATLIYFPLETNPFSCANISLRPLQQSITQMYDAISKKKKRNKFVHDNNATTKKNHCD